MVSPRGYGQVGANLAVGQALYGQLFVMRQRAHVVEVKTQPAGVAQGTGLAHVRPQDGTQRGVQQVRAAVIARCVQTPLRLNLGGYGIAQSDVALGYRAAMDNQAGHRALGVLNLHAPVGGRR